jgi:hypothetical protein
MLFTQTSLTSLLSCAKKQNNRNIDPVKVGWLIKIWAG